MADPKASSNSTLKPIRDRKDRWAVIRELGRSSTVETVMVQCEEIARGMDPSHGVTSTVLLHAIVRAGQEQTTPRTAAIARFARLIAEAKEYESEMRIYLGSRRMKSTYDARNPGPLKVSPNAVQIFEQASALAKEEKERVLVLVEGRHLIAAFLDLPRVYRKISAWKVLDRLGFNRMAIREDLYRGLAAALDLSLTARDFWGKRLLVRSVEEEQPEEEVSRYLPTFDADDPAGADRLGFAADVEAMAALVASKAVEPPLSIGVFGDWGSGKSFFVQKLSRRVEQLGGEDGELFWPNIEVIEFNAWHYADANLWASLVAHVFDRLRHSGKQQEGGLKKKLANFAVAQAVQAEAKLQVVAAKQRLAAAQDNEGRIKHALKARRQALAANVAKDLWQQLQKDYSGNAEVQAARAKFQEIHLASQEVTGDIRAVYNRAQEAATTAGRMKLIGLGLLGGEGLKTIGWGLAVATVGALGLGALLYWLSTPQNIAAAIAACAQLGGTALAVVVWVRDRTKQVLAALEPVEKARAFIEVHLREVEKNQVETTTRLEAEIAQGLVSFKQATQNEAEAKRNLDEAEMAVRQQVSGELIRRFIEERAGSGDYAKHLGLIAMIRDDFQKLSELLSTHNRDRSSTAAREVPDKGINRIVLVIDDLDRCPPARVVEVLEAVFLLLSFPAFVVVVAVDARWVSHSLLCTYSHLLQEGETRNGPGRATPRDYLEKIFQIPYRVRQMNQAGYADLIDALTADDSATLGSKPSGQGSSMPDRLEIVDGQHRTSALRMGSAGASPVAPAASDQAPPRPTLQAMRLTEREIQAMKQLVSIVGRSPRATKRFVNIYRLLKAALPPAELRVFEADEFQTAMLLLAMAHHTDPAGDTDLEDALDKLPADLRAEWAPSAVHYDRWHDRIRQFSFNN